MADFKAGDMVRGTHPKDAVSGQLYPGEVTSTRTRTGPGGEVYEMVTVKFEDDASAELVAESLERA